MSKAFICILLLMISNIIYSQKAGEATYAFLNIPMHAKIAAYGGFNISDIENGIALCNPNFLNTSKINTFSATYVNYIADLNFSSISYNFNKTKTGFYSIFFNYFNYGEFLKTNEIGEVEGTFKCNDYYLNLAYSYKIDTIVSIGINVKPIYSQYYTYTSLAIAFDAGILITSKDKNTNFSILAKNFGYQLKKYTINEREKPPFDLQMGLTQKLEHSPFKISVTAIHLNDFFYSQNHTLENEEKDVNRKQSNFNYYFDIIIRHFVIGTEIRLSEKLKFLLGYNFQRRLEMTVEPKKSTTGLSFGIILQNKRFSIDYAYSKYFLRTNTHTFSINYKIKP